MRLISYYIFDNKRSKIVLDSKKEKCLFFDNNCILISEIIKLLMFVEMHFFALINSKSFCELFYYLYKMLVTINNLIEYKYISLNLKQIRRIINNIRKIKLETN
jgi:hypothetical protein